MSTFDRITVSLSPEVKSKGQVRAAELGLSVSALISMLICRECEERDARLGARATEVTMIALDRAYLQTNDALKDAISDAHVRDPSASITQDRWFSRITGIQWEISLALRSMGLGSPVETPEK